MTFDQQTLDQFKEKLLIMASHAEGMVNLAVRAHLDRDESLAKQTLETDETIDQFEIQIDRIALDLLSQAPGEFELRQITCGMKIARELERVGDEATTIARRAIELMALPPLSSPLDIAEKGLPYIKRYFAQLARAGVDHPETSPLERPASANTLDVGWYDSTL